MKPAVFNSVAYIARNCLQNHLGLFLKGNLYFALPAIVKLIASEKNVQSVFIFLALARSVRRSMALHYARSLGVGRFSSVVSCALPPPCLVACPPKPRLRFSPLRGSFFSPPRWRALLGVLMTFPVLSVDVPP
jgi:hypothetical protein